MLIGYVSNERYQAIPDALVELTRDGALVASVRSSASGAVHADVPAGTYDVVLARDGFTSKRTRIAAGEGPQQFRLLSDQLYGYMWPKWVCGGESSEFRVHSVAPYRLALWRYGLTRDEVQLVGWFDNHGPRAVTQLTPDGDYTQTGVGWNRVGWGSSHHGQRLEAPARSGLYFLHAENEAGQFTAFPWVVAPAQPRAKVAVLASTNTWNAYNSFGGRSNYVSAAGLPAVPTVSARQDLPRYVGDAVSVWSPPDDAYVPLSFDRPEPENIVGREEEITSPMRGRLPSTLAAADWRILGWLEQQRIAYDYYADAQLHDGTLDLDAYRVLVLGPHPEYWSAAMFERVEKWVHDRAGRLLYLGGNGLNCDVVPNADLSAITCMTHLNGVGGELGMTDPNDPDTYFDSRMHRRLGRSEASLLGVVTTHHGIMTAAPYRVRREDHWVFEGTALSNGDAFGEHTLHERVPGGASGHETDKLSPHSPTNIVHLAKGTNPDEGGADLTYFDTPSGGAVFATGSITWTAALHVDPHVSTITRNVMAHWLR